MSQRVDECLTFLEQFNDASGKVNCTRMRNEFNRLETERTILRNLLTDIRPLLEGCDCIHSDPENPTQCPCKRLRAELAKP